MNEKIMRFHYDYDEDILFFYSKEDYDYEFSERLNRSISIGLDDNNIPVDIEMLNASNLFNIKKYLIKNIQSGEIAIEISEDKIELRLILIISIHKKATKLPVTIIGENKSQIPNIHTEVAVASA